ncbi:O-succinylhomoserine sulfhydrylase [Stella humosa]|uniref:O-succinylhomoserine sulfhydrylase n=1 Tax=Stella humosa TaxID=94 RepID=A0A3N1M2P1_9PROT|nr:O-succinylhomoserine sulfhydrylase [Stella humosa]ROP99991.1 O-succinylhomoserine sulfhydrylase [Stella humosa]BBK30777.1 O-succinylhomoserine sulfhydrylase [Stella humosa]
MATIQDIPRDPVADLAIDTRLVRGATRRSGNRETSEALYFTSGFVYPDAETAEAAFAGPEDGWIYTRFGNPTTAMLEDRLALLENAPAARATATGMAAVFAALMASVKAGDRVVASRALFGSCHYVVTRILPRFGVTTTLVDPGDLDQWRSALRGGAAAILFETPSNPMLDLVDIAAVAELGHAAGARVIVDNVFATATEQRPLSLGADLVVYSATKHLDGQGRAMGGAVLGDERFVIDELQPFLRHTGPTISPFNSWVILKGMETLGLRMERHARSAGRIAAFLADHPKVQAVRYPGLDSHPQRAIARRQMRRGGAMLAVTLAGGKPAAFRFANALRLADISPNLGDAKTLVAHPATTTHANVAADERARLGIADGSLRLSVGLEDADDLLADMERALAVA